MSKDTVNDIIERNLSPDFWHRMGIDETSYTPEFIWKYRDKIDFQKVVRKAHEVITPRLYIDLVKSYMNGDFSVTSYIRSPYGKVKLYVDLNLLDQSSDPIKCYTNMISMLPETTKLSRKFTDEEHEELYGMFPLIELMTSDKIHRHVIVSTNWQKHLKRMFSFVKLPIEEIIKNFELYARSFGGKIRINFKGYTKAEDPENWATINLLYDEYLRNNK